MRGGSCSSDSRVEANTSGRAISESVAPGREERLAERSGRRGLGEERQKALREEQQPEQRQHDAGHAGQHLDRRVDRARQGARLPVLDQPDRDADAERRRDQRADRGHQQRPLDRVEDAAGVGLLDRARGRRGPQQARAQVGEALDQHEDDDEQRDQAQADAAQPGEPVEEAVGERPARDALARRAHDRRRRGGGGGRRGHQARTPCLPSCCLTVQPTSESIAAETSSTAPIA